MSETVLITYIFDFGSPNKKSFEMKFDESSFQLQLDRKEKNLPDWTRLENNKCANCPLKEEEVSHCPVAVQLHSVVDHFSDERSFRKLKVGVITPNRNYYKDTTMQEGLFSIFGLVMATAGCPNMKFLMPLARFHMPFATPEETIYKVVSHYLVENLLRNGEDSPPRLEGLNLLYKEINIVNKGMIKRIREASSGDAEKNAIVVLDNFTGLLSMEISDGFTDLRDMLTGHSKES